MPIYNKLVRDNIPQIIEQGGHTFTSRILAPSEHLTEIKNKLPEEVLEFQETINPQNALEEMADILELLHAALPIYGATFEELEQIRLKKKEQRGGFEKGIYLIEVKDD